MAERKVRKTAGKTAANTTKRTATKTTAKTAAKRTTRTKAAAKEDFRIGELDQYLFSMGTHYDIYKKLGAHPVTQNGKSGTYFAVWAPDARRVSVVGDFNMWDGNLHPMQLRPNGGIYELFIPNVLSGAVYKYQILNRYDEILYKSDPYGNQAQMRPDNGSVVADLTSYKWKDTAWVNKRRTYSRTDRMKMTMTIYEMHR